MPPERQLGSSIAAAVRALLDGDFSAAGPVMDWLHEHRPEDLGHFRSLVGFLAAGTFARPAHPGALRPGDWDDFRHGLTALFWFELYTADSTWAALTEAVGRLRAGGPRAFGFTGG
jgi:hypothetical protein